MALINCRNCGKAVSDRAKRCPHCGCPVGEEQTQGSGQQTTPPPSKSNKHNWFAVCLVSVCIICIIGIIIAAHFVNGGNTKTAVRKNSATTRSEQQAQTTQPEKNQEEEVVLPAATQETQTAQQSKPANGYINGHEWVDLGLSVKWATCNVGASSPGEYGNYYAWGETSPKSSYTKENSKTYGVSMGDIAGDPSYDAARANWGGTWRMPTKSEIDELIDKCQWTWTTMGGHAGCKVTGPSGNSIFLPAVGSRYDTSLSGTGERGSYWIATPYHTESAYGLGIFSDDFYWGYDLRYFGQAVRPVSD